MEWYMFGPMISRIRVGQKASTPGYSRTVIRRPNGLYWTDGGQAGKVVEIRDYLFSDIWTIYEDEECEPWIGLREQMERREQEMIINQYEDFTNND
ncbi:hypothetical protein HFE03_04485 [Paenibacillus sp. EKM102P]|uniref:hypothetical protein n=1 Tax=unclassified Paenibacillus TaxID=185978 RepID=UPI00142D79E0|nr:MULTISPECIES: hypothetical protein [unclassified Paenibacillus]KAF6618463.1 hypothetical protein HFE00_10320 [Paenibacillus sp. EKM101P]KAF6624809.1 hypothetical protein HFE03_04485 [Paenibacillus sp. EKM102P]KAF6635411.1 hypothetical protein HFE01_00550 [Paenibacillus sp. EKM10P]KAF6648879.1 hypothetical protein HFE02_11005 [Paenibacillus sp. EKM11P]